MELSKEQLDAVEAVKGTRNPALWDPRCQQYLEQNKKDLDIGASKGFSIIRLSSVLLYLYKNYHQIIFYSTLLM